MDVIMNSKKHRQETVRMPLKRELQVASCHDNVTLGCILPPGESLG
jgi:hypothetical protein